VPGRTSRGAVTRIVPLVAVQPKRLGAGNDAVQRLGMLETLSCTRSKKVELRNTLNGASTVPPRDPIVAVLAGESVNVPKAPIRETLSNGS